MLLNTYKKWFDFHDKPLGVADSSWTHCTIDGQVFYFSEGVEESGTRHPYRLIMGYSVVNNALKGRMWYYSGSEATWRVFTGWRLNGAWRKGAEEDSDPDTKAYTSMGYVFECFTVIAIGEKLDKFWKSIEDNTKVNKSNELYPWGLENKILSPTKVVINDIPLYKYLISDISYDNKLKKYIFDQPGVSKEYNKVNERKFVLVGLPDMSGTAEDATKKIASVKMQNPRYGRSNDPNKNKDPFVNYSAVLGKETKLNEWLLSALDSPERSVSEHSHSVLNKKYKVHQYSLSTVVGRIPQEDLIIEVAASDSFNHHFRDWDDKVKTVNTPICWVRDVHISGCGTNSFGSRKEIPINMAFLVQKPCDYEGQILGESVAEIQGLRNNHIAGKYYILSMRNEETSPFIRKFKTVKGFNLLGEKKIYGIVVLDDKVEDLKAYVKEGIEEYNAIRTGTNPSNYSAKGYHGTKGAHRAEQLKLEVENSKTITDLNRILYACFASNTVGTFTGNWMTSAIQTNPTSLFTCVCRKLLAAFTVNHDSGIKKNEKFNYGAAYRGPQGALNRLIHYVQTTPVPENTAAELFITNEAANLLKAIKG